MIKRSERIPIKYYIFLYFAKVFELQNVLQVRMEYFAEIWLIFLYNFNLIYLIIIELLYFKIIQDRDKEWNQVNIFKCLCLEATRDEGV